LKERIAYATLVGLVAYAAVATDLYLPALPAIVDEFNVSEAQGQLTLSLFMLGMAVGQLFFGPLSDFYGRLPVVTVGTVFFIATSVACAAAPSMEFMWVTRFIQGLAASSGPVIARAIVSDRYAASSGPVIARAIVSDRYHGPRAAQVMSMLGAAMAVIPLIAPTIGSWILVVFDWRATYLALAVFAIAVLLGLRQFQESAPAIGQGGVDIGRIFRLFSRCLSTMRFIGYQICGTATYSAILAYLSTVAFFMRDVFELPSQYFGYAFAISVAGFMVGALLCSRLVMRLGTNPTMTIGVVLTLLAAIVQWWAAPGGSANISLLAVSSWGLFFGIGLTSANAAMGAISLFPQSVGAASAVFGFIHATVAAIAGFIAGQLYDGTLVPTATIMLICAAIGLLGVPLARGSRIPEHLN